jgi:hypothetical protein
MEELECFCNGFEKSPKSVGVLSIDAYEGEDISIPESERGHGLLSLRVQIGNISKGFRSVAHRNGHPIWNDRIHMVVNVYPQRQNPLNLITIALFLQGPYQREGIRLLGTILVHLHDVMQADLSRNRFTLTSHGRELGSLTLRMKFFYGSFGCGYGMQIPDEFRPIAVQVFEGLYFSVGYDDRELKEHKRNANLDEKDGISFKGANELIAKLENEKNRKNRISILRSMICGDSPSSEIPVTVDAGIKGALAQHVDVLIPSIFTRSGRGDS